MTRYYKTIREGLDKLISDGSDLDKYFRDPDDFRSHFKFITEYEKWCTRSLSVIEILIPHRSEDFKHLYKEINRLSELLLSPPSMIKSHSYPPINHQMRVLLIKQLSICESALDSLDDKLTQLKSILQADVFNSTIDAAEHLNDNGYFRAAGALAGVVLEKHLSTLSQRLPETIKLGERPDIDEYNKKLYKGGVYDDVARAKIKHLNEIRCLCDHNKQREPTRDEIIDLIDGVKYIVGHYI